ncbi:MAG: NAD-dependent protein deacylase [Chloroflexi bacterium]|nr:NAD-dependent protein deacylase [Chloroflexota bacterium]
MSPDGPAGTDGQFSRAAALLIVSKYVIAMTGAGMSVESGIPTFRGEAGLWARLGGPDPSQYQNLLADPAAYWKREIERSTDPYIVELRMAVSRAKPNPGHLALAHLEKSGLVRSVVTQNIDGLHQSAGSEAVIEVHGSRYRMRCLGCGNRTPREGLFLTRAPDPCALCGGLVKYDSVLFGEPVPRDVLETARAETDRADCVLVVGTSSTVRPAAGLPRIARANGARLIEVNPNATPLTNVCDVVVRSTAAAALPEIMRAVSLLSPAAREPAAPQT